MTDDVRRAAGVLEVGVLGTDARDSRVPPRSNARDAPARSRPAAGSSAIRAARRASALTATPNARRSPVPRPPLRRRPARPPDHRRRLKDRPSRSSRRRRTPRRVFGRPAGALEHLRPRLAPDDRLKIAHHARIRRRADDRADDVVAVVDVRDPVANRFARRVLERARAARDTGPPSRP